MLKRELDKEIREYYKESRNALLLTGARQTGKTFAVREFGKEFKSFIEINFIEHREAADLFSGVSSADEILMRLSLLTDKPFIENDTLIFFDEIQVCADLVTGLKFLVDNGKYRYILSGSLLGVELKDIRSEPVGYMSIKEVYPLTLREFAENLKVSSNVLVRLEECYKKEIPVDSMIDKKMDELFRLYLIVGGMPAAMAEYVETGNLGNVVRIQQDIVAMYRRDISQYAEKDKLKIKEIFDLIPSELDAKNKRFILKRLNEHAKFNRYTDSFLWLKDAGVAIPVYNVDTPSIPLRLAETRNLFKLFSNDVGLLAAQYSDGLQLKLLKGDININYGAVYENMVAQELLSHGFSLYYYNSKRSGEVDFIVQRDGKVLPIEVKSGKDYTRHVAINNLLSGDSEVIKECVVLCPGNVRREGRVLYLPNYMIMFIKPEPIPSGVYRPDFSILMD